MIISFEDYNGNKYGALNIHEDEFGAFHINVDGNIDVADIDFDDVFDTNERMIRVQYDFNKQDFELICSLKALFFDIDINYLCIDDLRKIYQYNLDIGKIVELDFSENRTNEYIYNEWKKIILNKYNELDN